MDATLNLSKLAKHCSDEGAARTFLESMRWPKGAVCPHCGGANPYKLTPSMGSRMRKGLWKCRACRRQFTVTVGTILENSHLPLSKWLLATHLLCRSEMSAHQLHQMLGVTYKSAWSLSHRLGHAMKHGTPRRFHDAVRDLLQMRPAPKSARASITTRMTVTRRGHLRRSE